ncbi:MAG: DUF3048 domain-containing protein [Chloroflexota bacterium]
MKRCLLPALLCLGLLLGACSSPAPAAPPPAPSATRRVLPSPTASATAAAFTLRPSSTPPAAATPVQLPQDSPTPAAPDINPLTGLRVDDPARLDRRPMVIKVTNFPRSVRPQWGLSRADHVYEYYLEDELTRFIGVFYGSDAERVGPVRSARPFDARLLRMYHGILTFGYADDRVIQPWLKSDIAPYLVIEHPDNCPPMCRIGPENGYNTLFTDTAALTEYVRGRGVDNQRQDLQGLTFSPEPPGAGTPVDQIAIRFSLSSYSYWDYAPGARRYARWQETDRLPPGQETYAPLLDSLSGSQLSTDNVVVLLPPASFFFLSNDTEVYDFELSGSGRGYAFRDGSAYLIAWSRASDDRMLRLTLNGRPYALKPGSTWFEILSAASEMSAAAQVWKFNFIPPQRPATPTPQP